MENIIIDRMTEEDIPQIQQIEKQSFDEPWPHDGFDRELENKKVALYLVIKVNGIVAGYLGSWLILEEAHITTFAVAPQMRGKKLGLRLMLEFAEEAIRKNIHWSTLEVNEINEAAIKLYEKFGYKKIGVRKKYYNDIHDAHIMWVGQMHMESFRNRVSAIKKELMDKNKENHTGVKL